MIVHLQINGFGKLRGAYTFSSGLNVVVQGNRSGKSTFAALLYYLFYPAAPAFSPVIKPLSAYFPRPAHTGCDFSASATLHFPSEIEKTNTAKHTVMLTLWHDFAHGKCVVLDAADGRDITPDFTNAAGEIVPGEKLFGLSAQEFLALAFIPQSALPPPRMFAFLADKIASAARLCNPARPALLAAVDAARRAVDFRPNCDGSTDGSECEIAAEIEAASREELTAWKELTDLENAYDEAENDYAAALTTLTAVADAQHELAQNEFLAAQARLQSLDTLAKDAESVQVELNTLQAEMAALAPTAAIDFSDYSTITTKITALNELKNAVSATAAKRTQARDEHRQLELRLRTDGNATTLTREQLTAAETTAAQLEEVLEKENALRIDLRRAAAVLQDAGMSQKTAEMLDEWLTEGAPDLWAIVAAQNDTAAKLDKLAKNKAANDEHAAMLTKIYSRDKYTACRHIGLALILLIISALTCVLLGITEYMLVPAALCIGWIIYGGQRYRAARRFDRSMRNELAQLEEAISAENAAATLASESLAATLAAQAAVRQTTAAVLRDTLTQAAPMRDGFMQWQQSRLRLRTLERTKDETAAILRSTLAAYHLPAANFDLRQVRFHLVEIRKTLDLRERTVAAWTAAEEADAKAANAEQMLQKARQELQSRIHQVLGIAEIPSSTITASADDSATSSGIMQPAADAAANKIADDDAFTVLISRYTEVYESQKRWRTISDQELPAVARKAAEFPTAEVLANNRAHYAAKQAKLLAIYPVFAKLSPERTAEEYEADAAALRKKIHTHAVAIDGPESAYQTAFAARANRAPKLRAAISAAKAERTSLLNYQNDARAALTAAEDALAAIDRIWPDELAAALNAAVGICIPEWIFAVNTELHLTAHSNNGSDDGISLPAAQEVFLTEEQFATCFSYGQLEMLYWHWRLLLGERLRITNALLPWPLVADEPLAATDTASFNAGTAVLPATAAARQVFVFSCRDDRWQGIQNS